MKLYCTQNLRDKLRRFVTNSMGVISIEVTLLAPIIITAGFATYDIAVMQQSKTRAQTVMYALSDALTSRTEPLTCDYLDTLANLAYRTFQTGNAGRLTDDTDLPLQGAEDFNLEIIGAKVPARGEPRYTPSNRRGLVRWAFQRNGRTFRSNRKPNDRINIPHGYRIEGEYYIFVEGSHWMRPPLNILGFFGKRSTRYDYSFIVAPRYVPEIDLVGPEVARHCENDDPGIDS